MKRSKRGEYAGKDCAGSAHAQPIMGRLESALVKNHRSEGIPSDIDRAHRGKPVLKA